MAGLQIREQDLYDHGVHFWYFDFCRTLPIKEQWNLRLWRDFGCERDIINCIFYALKKNTKVHALRDAHGSQHRSFYSQRHPSDMKFLNEYLDLLGGKKFFIIILLTLLLSLIIVKLTSGRVYFFEIILGWALTTINFITGIVLKRKSLGKDYGEFMKLSVGFNGVKFVLFLTGISGILYFRLVTILPFMTTIFTAYIILLCYEIRSLLTDSKAVSSPDGA